MTAVPANSAATSLVIFFLDEQRYALPLDRVERAVARPALQPFPRGPAIVSGIFVLHGELVPVVNVRARFRLPERPARLSDQLLVVRTPRRRLALIVDHVERVADVNPAQLVAGPTLVPGLEFLRGVVRLEPEGVVFVHDIDAFLSLEEEAQLAKAHEEYRP